MSGVKSGGHWKLDTRSPLPSRHPFGNFVRIGQSILVAKFDGCANKVGWEGRGIISTLSRLRPISEYWIVSRVLIRCHLRSWLCLVAWLSYQDLSKACPSVWCFVFVRLQSPQVATIPQAAREEIRIMNGFCWRTLDCHTYARVFAPMGTFIRAIGWTIPAPIWSFSYTKD